MIQGVLKTQAVKSGLCSGPRARTTVQSRSMQKATHPEISNDTGTVLHSSVRRNEGRIDPQTAVSRPLQRHNAAASMQRCSAFRIIPFILVGRSFWKTETESDFQFAVSMGVSDVIVH